MTQCYALGPSEELSSSYPDWDAPDEPPEKLAPGHPDWDAPHDPVLCSRVP